MKKHKYTARKPHGNYPAGEQVIAWRDKDYNLWFRYKDGVKLNLGKMLYLEGIEPNPIAVEFLLAY